MSDTPNIDTLIDRLTDRQRREFSLWCAERVRRLMTDPRSTTALDVADRHLRGEATEEELAATWYAAWAAARAAALAVARAAKRAATGDEAWDAELAAQRAELERMLGEVECS